MFTDVPTSVGDLETIEVKVDITELTDTASEVGDNDTSSEYTDTELSEDDIANWKDDPNEDPDWDPDSDSDIADKSADPENSGSTTDCDSAREEVVDESRTLKCQACDSCFCAPNILKTHVTKKHYMEASRNGVRMCHQCGKVEESLEKLQEHREVSHCH